MGIFSQYCSSPSRQFSQTPTIHPTAAMSPSLNRFTALPAFTTSSDNFVPWHAGIHCRQRVFPIIADLVQIRVANAAVQDLDLDILGPGSRRSKENGVNGVVAERHSPPS